MNILFLSLLDFETIEEHTIYTDLLREFRKNSHKLYIVSPIERRKKRKTYVIEEEGCKILKLKIGNIQKTNYIEKGLSLLSLQRKYIRGIECNFADVQFDLILYATPPVTLQKVVQYVKERDNSITYLLLKDIWPQGVVDLGVIKPNSIIYHYFRKKEKAMYAVSDYIGCMSENNVKYLLEHNPQLNADKVEVCPNSIEPQQINKQEEIVVKKKYGIPLDKVVFLYGGNLGRPQGLDFLLQIIERCEEKNCFFLIVGDGTEYQKISNAIEKMDGNKAKLIKYLPRGEYEQLVNVCDVGLVFLNSAFTVPNIPSRILLYMQAAMPMLAATDESTDLKRIFQEAHIGYWCQNGDMENFLDSLSKLMDRTVREEKGSNAREYLEKYYTVKRCYDIIIQHMGVRNIRDYI